MCRYRTAVNGSSAADGSDPLAENELHELIEALARDSRGLEARFNELEAIAALLRNEVEASAHRLRLLITQLELAEERLPQPQPASGSAARNGKRVAQGPARRDTRDAYVPQERLCAREREVLELLTEGMRSPCIARKLGIKTATVEVHRRNIMRKLNLHSVAALTKYALRTGLISL
jgi:DNA-binding NarL/FixJ family response regulator